MTSGFLRAAIFLAAVIWLAGCAATREVKLAPLAVNATGMVKTAAPAAEWRRTELYFGLRGIGETGAEEDRGAWSEARWQRFLDEVVTPEFPAGFSVLDAYGQWKSARDGKIYGLVSKIVVILHAATPEDEARIERVRANFKTVTGQESVLRGTQSAEVAF